MGELNDRQRRFVEAMLVETDAKAAYVKAGYKARGAAAEANASRLLRNDKVSAALAAAREERSERVRVDADRAVKEIAKLGLSDIRELAEWDERGVRWRGSSTLSPEAAACVKGVSFKREVRYDRNGDAIETTTTSLQLHDKVRALKLLGDHLGIFGRNGGDVDRALDDFMRGVHTVKDLAGADLSE